MIQEGTVLKPVWFCPEKDCKTQASIEQVAAQTIACLKENVPHNLAGIVFLSGGKTDEKATAHLDAMNRMDKALPWY